MSPASSEIYRVERPLRIDLAGGWSDTPPICNERGGAVLNVAVTGYSFDEGGLSIRIFADVPKGSGMGTSSILGSALVEALLLAKGGEKPDRQRIGELTLALEQEMLTGGGWQDQLGALYPGVKLLETRPGERQIFKVKRLEAKAEAAFAKFLKERGVLYFTGQKRMARNVLRGVLDFYAKNPEGIAEAIVATLKRDAKIGFAALKAGDFTTFGRMVNAYWLNKKALDPGSTNPVVESIIARIAPWTEAVTLTGAGGGGFLFALAKSRAAKAKMEKVLASAGNGGKCYRFSVDF